MASKAKAQTVYRGISAGEGAWRLVPLPEDRVLKVLVPFLGNALCCDDEKWVTLKCKWEEQLQVYIDLRGRKSRGNQWVGNSIARDLVTIGPDNGCVRSAFDFILDRARHLQLSDVQEIAPPRDVAQQSRDKARYQMRG